MSAIKTLLLLCALMALSLASWAQIPDSTRIRKGNKDLMDQERRRDSLEAAYFLTHNYFEVSLEVNHAKVPIDGNIRIYASDKQLIYPANRIDNNRYLFGDLPDSVKFVLESGSIKIETGFMKRAFFKNGARMRFGTVDNILLLKRNWEDGKHVADFNDWTETKPYLDLIKDKKLIRAARRKQIESIDFVVFSPNSYKHGINITHTLIRPRSHKH